jgi:hypothetical protein
MNDTQEHTAGFAVFFFDVIFDIITQSAVSANVFLDNIAGVFVDNDDVIILEQDLVNHF